MENGTRFPSLSCLSIAFKTETTNTDNQTDHLPSNLVRQSL